ncbi:hypothetical protein GAYE_SCF08G3078 [Galdieria yellowstonensis]|uniref:Uncharacterized protein n=1 Tax=Galdieria yellowstonensis TaxID=3028027 RepID=A0AAV9ICT2_9RHOD|nr:hypothetical protein GAYE_SCF08G3078 [Galdieria yellowstonensis]
MPNNKNTNESEDQTSREKETQSVECEQEKGLEQQKQVEQKQQMKYRILDWSDESLELDAAEPGLFSTEEALAALTISEEVSSSKSDSGKNRSSVAEPKTVQTSVKDSELGSKAENKTQKREECQASLIRSGDLKVAEKETDASCPKQGLETFEEGLWKEDWYVKGTKAFEVSCKNSEKNTCEVKDILRLPGLLFVDVDKNTFIAAYRSVEKAKRSLTRLSKNWALSIVPITEANEKSQKLYFEKCPPSNRPPKTTAVAERMILRSLGLRASAASRTKI